MLLWAHTSVSMTIAPDADHVNTSICPGVSNNTYLTEEWERIEKEDKSSHGAQLKQCS